MQQVNTPSTPVIITGVARGGTSLIASICAHLGIWMGKGGPRYENPYLQRAVLLDRWDVVEMLVAEIERGMPLWGWKMPGLAGHLDKLSIIVPKARYIFIRKDLHSVAKRRAGIGEGPRYEKMLKRSHGLLQMADSFNRRSERPVMMLDYEDVVANVPGFAGRIADFCRVPAPNNDIAAGVAADGAKYKSAHVDIQPILGELSQRLLAIAERHGVTLEATQALLAKSNAGGTVQNL